MAAAAPLRPEWGSKKEPQVDRDPVQGQQSRCEEGSQAGVPEAGGEGLSQAPRLPGSRSLLMAPFF